MIQIDIATWLFFGAIGVFGYALAIYWAYRNWELYETIIQLRRELTRERKSNRLDLRPTAQVVPFPPALEGWLP